MPLYELFCLTRPAAGRKALAEMIKTAGQAVLQKGGVLTDVTFYGEQKLAYQIRDTTGKFDKVEMHPCLRNTSCQASSRSRFDRHQPSSCLKYDRLVLMVWLVAAQADMWQVQFMVTPPVLSALQHNLTVDERVLRYIVQKKRALPPYPNTHRVKSFADRLMQPTRAQQRQQHQQQ